MIPSDLPASHVRKAPTSTARILQQDTPTMSEPEITMQELPTPPELSTEASLVMSAPDASLMMSTSDISLVTSTPESLLDESEERKKALANKKKKNRRL